MSMPPRVTVVPSCHQKEQQNWDEDELEAYFSLDAKVGAEALAEAFHEVRMERLSLQLNKLSLGRDNEEEADSDKEHRYGEHGVSFSIKTHKLAYNLSQNEEFDCKYMNS